MLRSALLSSLLLGAGLLAPEAMASGWTVLTNQPNANASTMFLLMDGRVLMNDIQTTHWFALTPDVNGSYLNGTWKRVANSNDDRLYFASGILADGRLILSGGEYSNSGGSETNHTEIYDPVQNTWTVISPPTGWSNVGDAPSVVMPDGRFFIGSIYDTRTAIMDPVTLNWTATASVLNSSSTEETWILLPDGTVLCVECYNHPYSQLYDPVQDAWVDLGAMGVDLVQASSLETGPGMMLYTGEAWQVGATPHSARYTPSSTPGGVGTWNPGNRPPLINGKRPYAKDAPASILPNGHVLCALANDWSPPVEFCEYTGKVFVRTSDPGNNNGTPYNGRMLPLPTGEVLYANGTIWLYTGDPGPDPSWLPTITSVASDLLPGESYVLSGTQLNGWTQGNSYGDECGVATNYPLVRITNSASGHVFYCRTHDPSTMAIATGTTPVSTHFVVPTNVEAGPSILEVVANGLASLPQSVVVRSPIHIDFDALPTGTVVTNQYPDATFSAPSGFSNWTVAVAGGTSQPNVLMTGPAGGGSDGLEETDVDFRCPMASLTFQGVNIDGAGTVASVNVFQFGVLTATVPVVGAGDPTTPVRVDLTSFNNVTRIEITAINDAGGIAWDDFNFCLSSSASWSNYGSGFPGTLGVPGLTAEEDPILGTTVTLDLGNSLGATTTAMLMTGVQQAVIPTAKGGDLLLVPLLFVPLALPATGTTLSGNIPNDPSLCGVSAFAQALELDAGAAHGLSFTAGLQLTLGN
jgi:hypothetical protein